jgi:hypothetical protein
LFTDKVGLLGGEEFARKVAGHELKGLMSCITSLLNKGIHFPLFALFHYRGRTITATALLPIDETTLAYGSANGGKTIVKKVRIFFLFFLFICYSLF